MNCDSGVLEERLSNGRRKRQVTLVVSHKARPRILESLMGTAHGAEELGLCPHGLACQAGAWGRYQRVLPRIWPHLDKIQKWSGRQKYSARPITLAHDEILTNGFLRLKRGTL